MRGLPSWRDLIPARFSTNDVVRLGASLVLAILLWGWVTSVQDPVEAEVFAGLTVDIPQLPDALLVVGDPPQVSVTIEGPASAVEGVDAADLEPRLDLDEIESEGEYTVDVEVSEPDGTRAIRVEPEQVPIVVEPTVLESFELVPVTQQPDDAARSIVRVDPEVSEVNVTGPRSRVQRVARVILPVEIGSQTTDYTDRFTPVAQDGTGSRIPEVTIVPDRITARVAVATQGKSVAVIPQVVGDPAAGFEISGRIADPQQVLVDGPQEILDDLISVPTAPVDVSGATDTVTERVEIATPPGVRVFEPRDGMVLVEVQIRQVGVSQPLAQQTVNVVGLGEGLRVAVEPTAVDVIVQASESILTGLTATDIAVQVNAAGVGPGTHRLQPTVAVPPNVEWIRTEPGTVTVTITSAGDATPPPGLGGPAAPSPAESLPAPPATTEPP